MKSLKIHTLKDSNAEISASTTKPQIHHTFKTLSIGGHIILTHSNQTFYIALALLKTKRCYSKLRTSKTILLIFKYIHRFYLIALSFL